MTDPIEQAEYEAMCDKHTSPLREETQAWARARGLSFSSRYIAAEHLWRFDMSAVPGVELAVEIDERGEWAKIGGEMIEEPAPRRMTMALNRWEKTRRKP